MIYKRRNSAYMDSFATDAALKSLDQISLNANGNGNGIEAGTMLVNQELIERLLNLMRFETLHDWLAPTGRDMRVRLPHNSDVSCRSMLSCAIL